jgi:hypothetical protein
MDETPNPAFNEENVNDLFSGLNGYDDIKEELEQAYKTASPVLQEKASAELQRGINKLTGQNIKPQKDNMAVIQTQTQPWMWIVLGLVVGGGIYLMTKEGGK